MIWRLCAVVGANALCPSMELTTLEVRTHSTSRRSSASLHGFCESTRRVPWTFEHPESVRHAQRFPRPCFRPSECVPTQFRSASTSIWGTLGEQCRPLTMTVLWFAARGFSAAVIRMAKSGVTAFLWRSTAAQLAWASFARSVVEARLMRGPGARAPTIGSTTSHCAKGGRASLLSKSAARALNRARAQRSSAGWARPCGAIDLESGYPALPSPPPPTPLMTSAPRGQQQQQHACALRLRRQRLQRSSRAKSPAPVEGAATASVLRSVWRFLPPPQRKDLRRTEAASRIWIARGARLLERRCSAKALSTPSISTSAPSPRAANCFRATCPRRSRRRRLPQRVAASPLKRGAARSSGWQLRWSS